MTTTAANVGRAPAEEKGEEVKNDEKIKRRMSMMGAIKSLGAPSIVSLPPQREE
jgi:hypothetical protein